MKKLLRLLTISTLTSSLPAPLLANTQLGRDIDKTTAELIRNKIQRWSSSYLQFRY